jgi:hypothetical protein
MGIECLVKPLVGFCTVSSWITFSSLKEMAMEEFLHVLKRLRISRSRPTDNKAEGTRGNAMDEEVAIDIKKKLHRMPTANYLPDFVAG